jgi:translation initiation factor 4E
MLNVDAFPFGTFVDASKNARAPAMADVAPQPSDPTHVAGLNSTWTVWHVRKDYTVVDLDSFSTVRGFWGRCDGLGGPHAWKTPCNLAVFRDGVRPLWEDPANDGGATATLCVARKRAAEWPALWTELMMCLVGETHDDADVVLGLLVGLRPGGIRANVWLRRASDAVYARIAAVLATAAGRGLSGPGVVEVRSHASLKGRQAHKVRPLASVPCRG